MKAIFRIFLLLALLPVGGCSSIQLLDGKAEAPSVALAGMELQGIKGLETIFRLELRIRNPNGRPLEVRGLNCELKISGKAFADGSSDEHVSVPASGDASVPVLLYTSEFDLTGSVIGLLQGSGSAAEKPLQYELTGRLRTGGKGEETTPFTVQGSLPAGK
jgi:LEA14-like dessication related protein